MDGHVSSSGMHIGRKEWRAVSDHNISSDIGLRENPRVYGSATKIGLNHGMHAENASSLSLNGLRFHTANGSNGSLSNSQQIGQKSNNHDEVSFFFSLRFYYSLFWFVAL